MRLWFAWNLFECAVYLMAMPCLVLGQATKQGPVESRSSPPPSLIAEIQANERAVWEAAKVRDMRTFADLVADDARMVFTSGVMTKQEYIGSLGKRTITDYALRDFQVFMPAEGTVITLYQATVSGSSSGKIFPPTTLRESSVWVKHADKWVAVWNQETPLD